ncbi:hypothetical protein ANN_04073 [Periplaneta americana]|uniref:Uncharacterized protein n=1 Tax=Periplaneta americana TaxID=6978 RepID=A0ABQ8T9K2_PERAM|nr:hypothetical protein ANN_04073 [Periplaneta americana]
MAGLCEGGNEPSGSLKAIYTDRDLKLRILWTDEANFKSNGQVNLYNARYWYPVNPHWLREVNYQHVWSLNTWCGFLGQRDIRRGGPIAWPPRSPDLTPLDFFLWGRMKSLAYETPVETAEDLVARVVVGAGEVADIPGVIERVYQNIIRRYNACNEVGGRHIEPHL